MAERQIDTDRYAADENLDSAVVSYVAEMGLEAQQDATRGCVAAWDYRWPPYLHSCPMGSNTDADPDNERGFMIFVWRPASRASTLTVNVRGTWQVGTTVLYLGVTRLSEFVRSRTLPADLDSDQYSSGEQTATLTASGLSLETGVAYAVIVSAASTVSSTAEVWYDANSSPGTALNSWRRPAYMGEDAGVNTYWGTSAPVYTNFDNEILPYYVEFVNGASPHSANWDDTKAGPLWPLGRLARRMANGDQALTGTGYDTVYVWPPIGIDSTLTATLGAQDWIRRKALSYVEMHGVQITETVTALPSFGTSLAPDAIASADAGRLVDRYAGSTVANHPMVYAIAPTCDYADADSVSTLGYNRHAGVELALTTSYQTIQTVELGDGNRFAIGATNYVQSVYRVTMVLHLLVYRASPGDKGDLQIRAKITEEDGSTSASTTFTQLYKDVPVTPLPAQGQLTEDAGYWLGGYSPSLTNRTPPLMSTTGFWCEQAWRTARPIVIEFSIRDDTSSAADMGRLLTIEVQRNSNVTYPTNNAYLILDSLNVDATPGTRPQYGQSI